MKFQLHTLQLLPEPERPSYAGAVVDVLEGLDGRLRVRHEGRIINAQEAPPSPVFLRNGHGGPDSSCLPRRIRPVEPALGGGPQVTGLKTSR